MSIPAVGRLAASGFASVTLLDAAIGQPVDVRRKLVFDQVRIRPILRHRSLVERGAWSFRMRHWRRFRRFSELECGPVGVLVEPFPESLEATARSRDFG